MKTRPTEQPRTVAGLVDTLAIPRRTPPPVASSPDTLGRYVVTGEIGEGGMGRVLSAYDPEIGRVVAVKVLKQAFDLTHADLQRFVAEARITGQLEHPGIVPVYDVGVSGDGQVFLVMKKVEGRPLARALEAGDLGPARLLAAFVDICEAVAFAHHRGVIHQDLKPENVLLGAFGEVLVVDWGIAALWTAALELAPDLVDSLRGDGTVSGSPGYIAPERLGQPPAPPHPLSDQWSLGAILYLLLCGQRTYPGRSVSEIVAATCAGPPEDVRLRDLDREVPDEIADVCMRALSEDPEARFPDVAALADAVRGFLEGRDRRARALEQVARADALIPELERLHAASAASRAQAEARLAGVPPRAPVEDKLAGWALQDEAQHLEEQAVLARLAWEQTLRGALNLVPDLHEAHRRLANWYREEVERLERVHDTVAARRAAWLLGQHDRGYHRTFLQGAASLTIVTDPEGASVSVARYELRGRRLVPGEERAVGRTPLVGLQLPPGSYRCRLVAQGRADVIYPVHLPRAGTWDGVPPGGVEPWPVYLPTSTEIGDEDRYVPAGWCQLGGDADAPDALTPRRVWVDAFVMRAFPLTNRAMLTFLNGLLAAGRGAEAERLQPRLRQRPTHPLDGDPALARAADGRFLPPTEAAADWLDHPVLHLDLVSARALAAATPGGAWRLPDEAEWEKAARGVDGRFYPWGDQLDPAFANMVASRAKPADCAVAEFPADESVYGVRGLGGNARCWCGNRWTEPGPVADARRLVHQAASEDADFIAVRGGAWASTAPLCRSAARFGDPPTARYPMTGVRLVRSLG